MRPASRDGEGDGLSVVAISRDVEEGEEASGETEERARNQNNTRRYEEVRAPLYIRRITVTTSSVTLFLVTVRSTIDRDNVIDVGWEWEAFSYYHTAEVNLPSLIVFGIIKGKY